ncbi:MAG: hypothetical protein WDZ41_02730 [Candidatus Babeliales bacterium]
MKRYLIILSILGLLITEQAYGMEFPLPRKAGDATSQVRSSNKEEAERYIQFLREKRNRFLPNAEAQFKISFPTAPAPSPKPKPAPAPEKKGVNFDEVKKQAQAVRTQGQMVVKQAETAKLLDKQKEELATAIGFPDFASMKNAWQ